MNSAALFVAISYVSVQLISNVSSAKIGLVFGYAVDMGVFLYPLSFTLRDLVHRELGKELTKRCIYYAVVMNLLMSLYFAFVALFKSDPNTSGSAAFDQSLFPVWRIVAASLAAQLTSELIDTEVYHAFVTKFRDRCKWGRVLVSNSVSIPVDNAVFCLGAFGGLYDWHVIREIFVFNFIVKYAVSILSIPMIYIRFSGRKTETPDCF